MGKKGPKAAMLRFQAVAAIFGFPFSCSLPEGGNRIIRSIPKNCPITSKVFPPNTTFITQFVMQCCHIRCIKMRLCPIYISGKRTIADRRTFMMYLTTVWSVFVFCDMLLTWLHAPVGERERQFVSWASRWILYAEGAKGRSLIEKSTVWSCSPSQPGSII